MKTVAGLLVLSVVLLVATFGQGSMSHTLLPQPDPPPEQAAHEAFHRPIGSILFLATGVSFLVALLTGLVAGVEGMIRLARERG